MTTRTEPKRLSDLLKLLEQLRLLQVKLLETVWAKVDAMKRADIAAMREQGLREERMAKELQSHEGVRRRILDRIGEELGMQPGSARALTLSQLASRVGQPHRETLLAAGQALRGLAAQVAQANRVAGVVAREVVNHLSWVFMSVRPKGDGCVGYTHGDAVASVADSRIFEAVG